jgi:HJR/Mrr/RecB family endonuclease
MVLPELANSGYLFSNFKELITSFRANSQIIDRVSGPEFEEFIFTYFRNSGAIEASSCTPKIPNRMGTCYVHF